MLAFGVLIGSAQAGTSSLTGWAWSSNTGWVSFNSTNVGAGGGGYSVTISTTTPTGGLGALGGYAWSGHVDAQGIKSGLGWISFNPADVAGCPNTTGALNGCNPTIDMTTGKVTGWARVLSVKNPLMVTSGSTGGSLATGYVASVFGGNIWTSTDGGTTWVEKTASGVRFWDWVSATSDGQTIFAYDRGTSPGIYRTTDGGTTWTAAPGLPGGYYSRMSISSDNQTLVTSKYFDSVYVSTNGGTTWTARQSTGGTYGVAAVSANGAHLVSGIYGGAIYTSTDAGLTWTPRSAAGSGNWSSVAISNDGQKIAAMIGSVYSLSVRVSTDGGVTWSTGTGIASADDSAKKLSFIDRIKNLVGVPDANASSASYTWTSMSASDDGMVLAAIRSGGYVYVSTNAGLTWTPMTAIGTPWWTGVSVSDDGNEIVVTEYGDPISISRDRGATWTTTSSGGRNWGGIGYYANSSGGSTSSYDNRGGFDGWINLSGTNHASPDTSGNAGVTYYPATVGTHPAGSFSGFAWGSEVIGWLNFTPISGGGGVVCPGCGGTTPAPTAAISAAPASVTSGSRPVITWSSTNATACTGTNFSTGNATAGNNGQGQIQTTQTTYSVSCTGAGGTANASVIVPVTGSAGNLKLLIGDSTTSLPPSYYGAGYSAYEAKATEPFALRWNNGLTAGYVCSALSPSGTWTDWTNTNSGAILTSNAISTTIPANTPSGQYIFTISCDLAGDVKRSSVVLTVQSSTLEEF